MKKYQIIFFAICVAALSVPVLAQGKFVKRTVTKSDSFDFGSGGTLVVTGPPNGSMQIVGTKKNEVEITATIELQAASEADIDKLAGVTGFATIDSPGRTEIISYGTYNKLGDKKIWKSFPKNLAGLPMRIDYVIHVPHYSDLEIDGGRGDLAIAGVEGSMRVNFLQSDAKIEVVGGMARITVQSGKVDVAFGVNGWRGRFADIQVASGELQVRLPSNMSAEIDATILRNGKIENKLPDLKPRDRKVPFTDRSMVAKAGVGGAPLKFTVGDGTLRMDQLVRPL